MKRPLPNLLVEGFRLALRNWSFVVWAYAINLIFGLLAAVPFATGLTPFLDHSLAAQRIAGTIDISYVFELLRHFHQTSFFAVATHTAGWLTALQLLLLFLLFAGTIFVYVSAEPPQLSVLMRGGVAYFWRFVRAGLLVGCISVVILGILFAARAALLSKLGEVYVDRKLFFYSAISGAVVLFVAMLLRLWFDLVEVYIVHNVMDGESRVRQALLPAYRLLFRYFFQAVGCFLLAGFAGVAALAGCLLLWKTLVPAHQVWLACLLSQIGLFVLLASRFWQRGIEVALVMSADPPIVATTDEIAARVEEEEIPSLAGVAGLTGLSEPTLRDLVAKLRTEPWATLETTPKPTPVPTPAQPILIVPEAAATPAAVPVPETLLVPSLEPAPTPATTPTPAPTATPAPVTDPEISLLDLHDTKFPLGGHGPAKEPLDAPEKDPWRGKP
jgi:hypothetical protein